LVFLDIGMPEIDGLEFIELFPVRNFQVIYITAFEDFGIQAIKFGVIDYIVKPVSVSELQSAVAKAVNLIEDKGNKNKQKVRIPTLKGTDIVDTNSIVYIESDTYLCSIYLTSSEKIVISKSLKHFEEILPTDIFFRIHRSVLINLNFVESYSTIDGGTVKLKGFKSKLPISRRSKVEFFEKMKTFTV
jgi:two-component system, LytTR family, response regulator